MTLLSLVPVMEKAVFTFTTERVRFDVTVDVEPNGNDWQVSYASDDMKHVALKDVAELCTALGVQRKDFEYEIRTWITNKFGKKLNPPKYSQFANFR